MIERCGGHRDDGGQPADGLDLAGGPGVDGVDPLWCWAHIRRYFVRAGDAHLQLRYWRDRWVERIASLYVAHRELAAAEPATDAHRLAGEAFEAALADMDTARREQAAVHGLHPAAKKVLATLDREWEGLVRHRDSRPAAPITTNPSLNSASPTAPDRQRQPGIRRALPRHHRTLTIQRLR